MWESLFCIFIIVILFVVLLIISGFLTMSYYNLTINKSDNGEDFGYGLLWWTIVFGWIFSGLLLLIIIGMCVYLLYNKPSKSDITNNSHETSQVVDGVSIWQYFILSFYIGIFIMIGTMALISQYYFSIGPNSSANSSDIYTIKIIGWITIALTLFVAGAIVVRASVNNWGKGTTKSTNTK